MKGVLNMNQLKKILLFALLIAAFAFSGCTTPQVEIRTEYDKLTKAITAGGDKRADYLAPAGNENTEKILAYIWDKAYQAKEMIETLAGKDKGFIDSVNPMFMMMQSVPKDGQSQSLVTEFPYYIKDVKINVMTTGFSVNSGNSGYEIADVHFMLSVSAAAADKDGNILKHNNKAVTYTSTVLLMGPDSDGQPAPIAINFHKYKVSADSPEIPVYNLFYHYGKLTSYIKSDNECKIYGIYDSGTDVLTLQDLADFYK